MSQLEEFGEDASGQPLGRLISEDDADEYLGLPATTLLRRRRRGRGPVHVKIGGQCYYTKADLEAWVEASKVRRQAP